MAMKKSKITGWQSVYWFTFVQMIKSKTYLITTMLFCGAMLVLCPVISMMTSDNKDSDNKTSIKKVYIVDQSPLKKIDYNKITKTIKQFQKTVFIREDRDFKVIKQELTNKNNVKQKKSLNSILLTIKFSQGEFKYEFFYYDKSKVQKSDIENLSENMKKFFLKQRINYVGLSKEQISQINNQVVTEIKTTDSSGKVLENAEKSISESEYWIVYIFVMVLFIFTASFGGIVAGSVITEKSNKVIEVLMTSIKPLAIIIGKILAAFSAMFVQITLIIVSILISTQIALKAYNYDALHKVINFVKESLGKETINNLNIGNITIGLLILLVGFLFFTALGGLAGASVSRIEDTAEGTKILTITMLIGFYLDLALISSDFFGSSGFEYVVYMLPISSPFVVPAFVMMGKLSIGIGILSLLVLIISLCLLFMVIADVYENMIYYKGTMKLKEIISLAMAKRKARKSNI